MRNKRVICLTLLLALVLPALAAAQPEPIIWVSMVQAKAGQGQELTQLIIESNQELYQTLIADGAVLNWGVGQPINHRPGQSYSHVEVVVFPNWAGAETFFNTFMATMMAMSPEERQARGKAFEELVEPGSHFDMINRGIHLGGTPAGPPKYFNLAYLRVKPGADFKELFKTYAEPVMSALSTEGKIGMYGIEVPEIHGDTSWTHLVWFEMPGLGARDHFGAAMDAAEAARGEEANKKIQGFFAEKTDMAAHHDEIIWVAHWESASGGGEGGGD